MSSATPTDVAQSRGIVRNLPKMSNTNTYGEKGGPTDSMSERQLQLDHYWRYYRCLIYDIRKYDWNGGERQSHIETDAIAQSGVIPAGFYDAGGQTLPLKFRKPAVPYHLGKIIPQRFTGLLFSKKRHPEIMCDDPETQAWLEGFAEETRLWTKAIQMRNYGGGQGSVAIGFKFVKGKPTIELHDARWCTPEFVDREELIVDRMEKRYQFKEDVRTPEGDWEEVWYWYRRIITDKEDVVWPKVPVVNDRGDTGEPVWENEHYKLVDHNYGECPIIWIQNQPNEDDIDGDPDCYGAYDIFQEIDQLLSQASRGAKGNCDPTIEVASDAEFETIATGTGNAIQVEKGGRVTYLEMSGTGIERAMKLADQLEEKALVLCRCVLDKQGGSSGGEQAHKTATEIERRYSTMLEQADVLRGQYGEMGIKRLLEMVLRVAREMNEPSYVTDIETGMQSLQRTTIKLPKRRIPESPENAPVYVDRVIGEGSDIRLKWPAYFEPTLNDVLTAVQAAGEARSMFNIIDDKNAVQFVAKYLGIENVDEVVALIRKQSNQALNQEGAMGRALNSVTEGT